jgi:hypothetical protein
MAVVGLLLLIQKLRGVDVESPGAEYLGYRDQGDFSDYRAGPKGGAGR